MRSDIAIKDACFETGLRCHVERDTTLFFETVRYEITGEKIKILIVKKAIEAAIKEWND